MKDKLWLLCCESMVSNFELASRKKNAVALSKEGLSTSVINKVKRCHQLTFVTKIKLKLEAADIKRKD